MPSSRLSSFELLRVLAMLMVLAIHADFLALGRPSAHEALTLPLNVGTRLLVEMAGIVAVNVFVLISGWFGIRASVRGFCRLLFTCLFFSVGVGIVALASGLQPWPGTHCGAWLLLFGFNWFVKAYMLLYIVAPVLNAFVAHATRRTQQRVLIAFFALQTTLGWITSSADYFSLGYSPVSFIGLYLLARYVAVFRPRWSRWRGRTYAGIYVAVTLWQTAVSYFCVAADHPMLFDRQVAYIHPLTIIAALCLLLAFGRLHLRSRVVNVLAGSSFAVFLLHVHHALLGPVYIRTVEWIYNGYSGGVFLLLVSAFIIGVYLLAVLIDQLRIFLWRYVDHHC